MVFANCYRDFVKPAVKGSVAEADRLRAGGTAYQIPTVTPYGLSSHRNAVIRIIHNATAP